MSSLQERLAARREQLQQERTFVLPVLGYEDVGLHARYRVLSYEELRKIGKRNEKLEGTTEGELAVAADTLINACVELIERNDDDSYVGLGHRWTPAAVRELFGLDLAPDATAREAVHAVLPGTQLMLHFNEYDGGLSDVAPEIAKEMAEGESEPSEEG